MTKTCSKCHQSKPESEFYPSMKSTCKDCHRARQMIWDRAHRLRKIELNRQWVQRNPQRKRVMLKAHQAVLNAIRKGHITRPTTCPTCHQNTYCEASHADYDRVLDVTWKCRKCHRREDSKLPKTRLV